MLNFSEICNFFQKKQKKKPKIERKPKQKKNPEKTGLGTKVPKTIQEPYRRSQYRWLERSDGPAHSTMVC